MKRNQYRKPEPKNGRKSSRKKSQSGEEGRRIFSESLEENPLEEDPILNRPFCIHSTSPVALSKAPGTIVLFKLNEHGPALKVFWTRNTELGTRVGEGRKDSI
jgi:hypothetical protein